MFDLLTLFLFVGVIFGLAAAGVLWLCYGLFGEAIK